MRIHYLLFLFLPFFAKAQKFQPFKWVDSDLTFSSVEMKVSEAKTKKEIFSGYKDASIKLSQGTLGAYGTTFSLKLSGYCQVEDAICTRFTYKEDAGEYSMQYILEKGTNIYLVDIIFRSLEDSPKYIIVVIDETNRAKQGKNLVFTLKGFE